MISGYDTLSLRRPLLDLLLLARMQHQFIRVPLRHTRVSFGPVIRYGIRQDRTGAIESRGRDRARSCFQGC